MKLETMEDYYVEELKDLYDAEKQLLRALPRMAKAAQHEELKSAFQQHVSQTEEQMHRLEEIFEKHGNHGRGKRCKAMLGLIEEGKDIMGEKPAPELLDVGLITAAQKIEHYEIAGYGCMSTYAKLLGFQDDLELLSKTLKEEKETDDKLTQLAERFINQDAKKAHDGAGEKTQDEHHGRMRSAKHNGSARKSNTASRSGSKSRHIKTDGEQPAEGEAKATKDLDEIKAWAEARGGHPTRVKGTGSGKDPGMLRIDFPESGRDESSLEEISWEEWFEKFKDNNLTFLYQDKTKDGHESRFFKLVCMEGEKS